MAVGRIFNWQRSLLRGHAGGTGDRHDGLRHIAWIHHFFPGLLLQAVVLPSGLQGSGVFPYGLGSDRVPLPVSPEHTVLKEQPVLNPDNPGDLRDGLLSTTSLHPEGAAAISG